MGHFGKLNCKKDFCAYSVKIQSISFITSDIADNIRRSKDTEPSKQAQLNIHNRPFISAPIYFDILKVKYQIALKSK